MRFKGEGAGGLKRGSRIAGAGAGSGDAERDSEGEESREEDSSSSFSLSASLSGSFWCRFSLSEDMDDGGRRAFDRSR